MRVECVHGSLKDKCEICERDEVIRKLRGQLQNCVNYLERARRQWRRTDVYDVCIESANKVLYMTQEY